MLIVAGAASVALSAAAWHAAGEERRISDARVAALADAIALGRADTPGAAEPVRVSHLLSSQNPDRPLRRHLLIGGGMLAVVGLFAMTVGASRPRPHPAPTAAQPERLELIALGQERAGAALTVHGIVRNPAGGPPVDQLSAIVSAFDDQGRIVATADAPIEAATLAPGLESGFTVTVAGASAAGRYRVSFRRGGRVIPHVDRRG